MKGCLETIIINQRTYTFSLPFTEMSCTQAFESSEPFSRAVTSSNPIFAIEKDEMIENALKGLLSH